MATDPDLDELRAEGRERQRKRLEGGAGKGRKRANRKVSIPKSMSSMEQLEELIRTLQKVRSELSFFEEFELTIEPKEKSE